ncbi:hypothetical protein F441_12195 [Phytophthora nicotianae CJ01A1]|uniref:Uncharacterized protein n=3 Tax=Phytophthora nicotianae TaxID=4792 RepID=W2WPC1_PHYNI|nr:hypothetical protein L916_11866 [Phytophthora nicotianae]ETO71391.1 hypothetical protein F444_12318 [Phytophthora nicotianae P1976]ETP12395.1 hypothetical protein F441_12195 [Phytophthora nicotianae CJ01A1]
MGVPLVKGNKRGGGGDVLFGTDIGGSDCGSG